MRQLAVVALRFGVWRHTGQLLVGRRGSGVGDSSTVPDKIGPQCRLSVLERGRIQPSIIRGRRDLACEFEDAGRDVPNRGPTLILPGLSPSYWTHPPKLLRLPHGSCGVKRAPPKMVLPLAHSRRASVGRVEVVPPPCRQKLQPREGSGSLGSGEAQPEVRFTSRLVSARLTTSRRATSSRQARSRGSSLGTFNLFGALFPALYLGFSCLPPPSSVRFRLPPGTKKPSTTDGFPAGSAGIGRTADVADAARKSESPLRPQRARQTRPPPPLGPHDAPPARKPRPPRR